MDRTFITMGVLFLKKILHCHLDEINQTLHRMKHFIEKPIEKERKRGLCQILLESIMFN